MSVRASIGGAPFSWSVRTRWNDFDANGHVNNATYLTYLEEARDELFVSVGIERERTVLARAELSFRRPVVLGARDVVCALACTTVGRSSIATVERLSVDGEVVLDADCTSVLVDARGRSTPVPDPVRRALGKYPSADRRSA